MTAKRRFSLRRFGLETGSRRTWCSGPPGPVRLLRNLALGEVRLIAGGGRGRGCSAGFFAYDGSGSGCSFGFGLERGLGGGWDAGGLADWFREGEVRL